MLYRDNLNLIYEDGINYKEPFIILFVIWTLYTILKQNKLKYKRTYYLFIFKFMVIYEFSEFNKLNIW